MAHQAEPMVRVAGLPPGIAPGPLGVRFVAYLIDSVVPALIGLLGAMLVIQTTVSLTVVVAVASLLILIWILLVWWMFAVRAAGPGMRLMHLQLVGLANGRPIGWGRFFLRQLILFGLGLTGIGLLLMVIFLAQQPRRQGWHDLAVDSVVIKQRGLPASRSAQARHAAQGPGAAPVPPPGLPVPPGAPMPLSPPPGYATPQSSPAQSAAGQSAPVQPSQLSPPPYGTAPRTSGGPPPATAPSPVPAPQYGAPPRTRGEPAAAGPSPVTAPQPLQPPPGMSAPQIPAGAPIPPHSAVTSPAAPAPPIRPSGGGPSGTAQPASVASPGRPWPPASPSSGAAGGGVGPSAAASSGPGTWRAVLDDGREVPVDGLVLLGRNPQARPGEEHATLIKIADTTRTVSKSHLELGLNTAGLYVVDRGSTNGSTVTSVSGVSKRCAPGDPVGVEAGSIVSFGDHWLEIRRGG